jgi:uncharacterized protein (DUF1800 family)
VITWEERRRDPELRGACLEGQLNGESAGTSVFVPPVVLDRASRVRPLAAHPRCLTGSAMRLLHALRRRPLLVLPLLLAAACAAPAATGRAGVSPDMRGLHLPSAAEVAVREQTADQQVLQALNRLAFGPRPGDEAMVRAIGVDRWIALQLEPRRIPDPVGDSVASLFPILQLPPDRLLADYPPNAVIKRLLARPAGVARDTARLTAADSLELRDLRRRAQLVSQSLQAARVARAVASERQLDEVMTDFWLNHFSIFIGKNQGMRHWLVGYERDAIRPHALGRFRTLLGAVAHSPAMLVYLDNVQSVADSGRPRLVPARVARRAEGAAMRRAMPQRPMLAQLGDSQRGAMVQQLRQRRQGLNENYARELLELHTLGVDGGYTQQDVTEAARVLTGWGIEKPYEVATFRFNPLVHDAGEKTVLGTRFQAGRGQEEGEQLLDMLARHPSTARHIAVKLAQRFVSDTPPPALVERAAATFTRTDGDIAAVVRTIVTSPEFFSRSAWRAKVKSPFEVVTSALRAMGARPDTTLRAAQAVARLGQPIYGHQAPNGWPETGEAWVNTGAILNRINFGMAIGSGAMPLARPATWPGYDSLVAQPREAQVDAVVKRLLGGDVSADMRAILVSGDHPFLARADSLRRATPADTGAMAADGARAMAPPAPGTTRDPLRPRREPPPPSGLAQVLGLALGSPEFQRR